MIRTLAIAVLWGLTASAGAALAAPDPTVLGGSIDKAAPKKANDKDPALVVKAEILLDRAHASPGEIDGLDGDNFRNAVRAFQQVNGLPVSGGLDAATWGALKRDGAPVLKVYTITLADAAGPFTRAIPSNLEAMARLPGLSYTSVQAELAEKFHMSPTFCGSSIRARISRGQERNLPSRTCPRCRCSPAALPSKRFRRRIPRR